MSIDKEKILTKITTAIYKKAEKEHLGRDIVTEFISDLQYVFHKAPKKKDNRCWLCKGTG